MYIKGVLSVGPELLKYLRTRYDSPSKFIFLIRNVDIPVCSDHFFSDHLRTGRIMCLDILIERLSDHHGQVCHKYFLIFAIPRVATGWLHLPFY